VNDSGIQYKPSHLAQSGIAFDDAGERVPFVMPDNTTTRASQIAQTPRGCRQEVIVALVSRLLEAGDAESIGRKVLILAYLLPSCPGRPRTLEELGARFQHGRRSAESVRRGCRKSSLR